MNHSVIIRHAQTEDIPAIHQITHDAFAKYAHDLGMPQKVQALRETTDDIAHDLRSKEVLVALVDGEIVGSIRYEVISDKIAYVSRFGVKSDIHNTGVGSILMDAITTECEKKGLIAITLHTGSKLTNLVRYYYRMGFYILSTTTDKGYIRALFCKDLKPHQEDIETILNA